MHIQMIEIWNINLPRIITHSCDTPGEFNRTSLNWFNGGRPRGSIHPKDGLVSSSACPKCSHCMHTGRVKCKWSNPDPNPNHTRHKVESDRCRGVCSSCLLCCCFASLVATKFEFVMQLWCNYKKNVARIGLSDKSLFWKRQNCENIHLEQSMVGALRRRMATMSTWKATHMLVASSTPTSKAG